MIEGARLHCMECGRRWPEDCEGHDGEHVAELMVPANAISYEELERIRRETLEVNTVDGLRKLPPSDATNQETAADRFPPPEPPPHVEPPAPAETVEGDEIDPELVELMEQEGGFSQ